MTFEELQRRQGWCPIRDCPGRSVLRGEPATLSLAELCGGGMGARAYRSPRARDEIWVLLLNRGGVLSYRRADGTWLHTLNTPEGLERKLAQLEIDLG